MQPDPATLTQIVRQTFRAYLSRDPSANESEQWSTELARLHRASYDAQVDGRSFDTEARFLAAFENGHANELSFNERRGVPGTTSPHRVPTR